MDPQLQAAIDNPVVYTEEFRELMARIGVELSQLLGRDITLGYGDCYTVAFEVEIGLSPTGVAIDPDDRDFPKPWYLIRLHVSPKGPYFTHGVWQAQPVDGWPKRIFFMPWDLATLSVEIQAVVKKIEDTIAAKGYIFLTLEQCHELVPGKLQKIDGLPATVKSELFNE